MKNGSEVRFVIKVDFVDEFIFGICYDYEDVKILYEKSALIF